MALIVEDGSIVANANSYIDLTFLNAFAQVRGLTLPATDSIKEQYCLRAMDYLEALKFQGAKVLSTQSLQWPRSSVVIDDADFAIDSIPLALKNAQAQLVIEQQAGRALYPQPIVKSDRGLVIERTVGPITTKFADTSKGLASSVKPIKFASVELFLAKLLLNGGANLQTVRI